jgi:TatD DNase family protein
MLIDIHTHQKKNDSQELWQLIVGTQSLGVHPWELTTPCDLLLIKKHFQELKTQLNDSILAIGECGLDRRKTGIAGIEEQKKVFEWHLDWASEVNRPLIIHNVHADSDFQKILKDKKFKGKMLFHDYAGNLQSAKNLLSYDSYFSFGHRLFLKNSKASELLKSLPRDRIFLETDDQVELSIEKIYKLAELILEIDKQTCETLFVQNLKSFFSNLDNVSAANIVANLSVS